MKNVIYLIVITLIVGCGKSDKPIRTIQSEDMTIIPLTDSMYLQGFLCKNDDIILFDQMREGLIAINQQGAIISRYESKESGPGSFDQYGTRIIGEYNNIIYLADTSSGQIIMIGFDTEQHVFAFKDVFLINEGHFNSAVILDNGDVLCRLSSGKNLFVRYDVNGIIKGAFIEPVEKSDVSFFWTMNYSNNALWCVNPVSYEFEYYTFNANGDILIMEKNHVINSPKPDYSIKVSKTSISSKYTIGILGTMIMKETLVLQRAFDQKFDRDIRCQMYKKGQFAGYMNIKKNQKFLLYHIVGVDSDSIYAYGELINKEKKSFALVRYKI